MREVSLTWGTGLRGDEGGPVKDNKYRMFELWPQFIHLHDISVIHRIQHKNQNSQCRPQEVGKQISTEIEEDKEQEV